MIDKLALGKIMYLHHILEVEGSSNLRYIYIYIRSEQTT